MGEGTDSEDCTCQHKHAASYLNCADGVKKRQKKQKKTGPRSGKVVWGGQVRQVE